MNPPATSVAIIDGRRIEYRRVGREARTVVLLHGGHMSAACRFAEESYRGAGWAVLVVSRPGYGRTQPEAGPSVPEFVVRLDALCAQLGIEQAAAVGVSLGARSALTWAAYAPDRVSKVVAMCPTSFAPWPDRAGRRVGRTVFNPVVERVTWGAVHAYLRRDPEAALPRVVADLTTLPGAEAVRRLGDDRRSMLDFLLSCRSGRGFTLDLRPPTDVTARVAQPTLILATRTDGSVAWDHPSRLAEALPDARLVEVPSPTHLLWLGDGADATAAAIATFLN